MTGEKGGLLAGLRAEALKSRHAAPVRLAVLMALPMPLLGAMPYRGVQIFSAWNYWYALFLPVALSLVVACVARADARTRMRGLLGLGFPLGRAWWAKALWCLALCTLSNLVVFGIYLAGSIWSPRTRAPWSSSTSLQPSTARGGFEGGKVKRGDLEIAAASWLAVNSPDGEIQVRFDIIDMLVVSTDRALLRHHINAFSCGVEQPTSIPAPAGGPGAPRGHPRGALSCFIGRSP